MAHLFDKPLLFIFALLCLARYGAEAGLNAVPRPEGKFSIDEAISLAMLTLTHFASAGAVAYYLFIADKPSPAWFVAGCALVVLGFAGRAVSLRQMGDSYSQRIQPAAGATLVSTGAFGLVRHPLYLFYTLELAGLVAVRPNLTSLAMLMLELAAVSYRIIAEEQRLAGQYGQEYTEYRKRTRCLIPFIF